MIQPLLLSIDQGTTNTKAVLVNQAGRVVFRASVPVCLITPLPGHVEQDPDTLWSSVQAVLKLATRRAGEIGAEVVGIGLSNQRETAIAWNRRTGQALSPAISWQCKRSSEICTQLAGHAELVQNNTGLPLDPVVSASKWTWMIRNLDGVQSAAQTEELCIGTVDSWLIYKLTGGHLHACDHTNASRTALLNLANMSWDDDMLNLFGLPLSALPQLRRSADFYGVCRAVPTLEGVPVSAAIGDSHAALAGHGAFAAGTIKATYGTGSSLMMLTQDLIATSSSLSRTVAWSVKDHVQFAIEGNIFMTGAAVQWAGEFLGLKQPTEDLVLLAESVHGSEGVYLVPAMVGLGSPHWDAKVRGILYGLERHHRGAHLACAAIESIAYQVADVFMAMQALTKTPIKTIHVDGGATRNHRLMQFQSDVLGKRILRACDEELSALGAAYLAGISAGWWDGLDAVSNLDHESDEFTPEMDEEQRQTLYRGWKAAVASARYRPEVA